MTTIQVFDPPMCCSTGVCGPSVDPALARFAADLEWLRGRGLTVERFNLSQQPGAFARNERAKEALGDGGRHRLPLILVEGEIVAEGFYPARAVLVEAIAAITATTATTASTPATRRVDETAGGRTAARGAPRCC